MLVRVTCNCKKSWFVDDEVAGTLVTCKSCRASVTVPGGPAPENAAPSSGAAPAYGAAPPPPPVMPQPAPAAAGRVDQTGSEFFLTYQYPPPLWGDKKLYRVYRDPGALVFIHLGIFFDGVDFGALARSSSTQGDVKLMAVGVGVLVAGAEKLGAKMEEPKLRARLEAVEAMTPHDRLLEAAKKPNVLAAAKDMTDVKFVPWDGYKGPWATAHDGELMASFRFRLQSGGKYDVNIRDGADLALAIRWVQELVGPERVEVKFPTDTPPPTRR